MEGEKEKTGKSCYIHTVYNKGNQLFRFELYQCVRTDSYTKKGVDAYILQIQFNPSKFMVLAGVKEATQGKNYLAGNALALEIAIEQLGRILRSEEFRRLNTFERKPVDVSVLRLIQAHLTRDYRVLPLALKFRKKYSWRSDSRACWENDRASEFLALFANASPVYVKRRLKSNSKEYTRLEGDIKDLNQKVPQREYSVERQVELREVEEKMEDGKNSFHSPLNYVVRKISARHDVLYVKERYSHKKQFRGAAPRFETKLTKSEGIKLLGVDNLLGLHELLKEVDKWHTGGRVGQTPVIEQFLDARLQAWHQPSEKCRYRANLKQIPVPDEFFLDLLLTSAQKVYEAQKASGVFSSKMCLGKRKLRTNALEWKSLNVQEFLGANRPVRARCGICEECFEANHLEYLEKIRHYVVAGEPLDMAGRELVLFQLKMTCDVLKPSSLYQFAGQLMGLLDGDNEPTGVAVAGTHYKDLEGMIDYFSQYYDGDFLGVSRFDQRALLLESLTFAES